MIFKPCATLLLTITTVSPSVAGFVVQPALSSVTSKKSAIFQSDDVSNFADGSDDESTKLEATENLSAGQINSEALSLKNELLELARRTDRGFQASTADKKRARELIFDLARFNPTPEPASPYYADKSRNEQTATSTLAGKWTLVFTDAPDITGLDTSRNPCSTAKLGKIGQECSPPYIKNVIEWLRPDWASGLPLSGSDESRVLQKVVTSASATPEKPLIVDLKVAGLELEAGSSDDGSSQDSSDIASRIQKQGIPVGLLSANPVDLKGPWNPPFGQFEILYLDADLRIIKTGQNFVAVNQRIRNGEEWF
jgi:hypothetical protein